MALDTLLDLLAAQLRDLHAAERQVLLIWPQLSQEASSSALRLAIADHRRETALQMARLIEGLELLGCDADGPRSRGMEGLMVETLTLISAKGHPAVVDAAILAGCLRVGAYEQAGYATAIEVADTLGLDQLVDLLGQTLIEEEATRRRLEMIARTEVHPAAREAVAHPWTDADGAIPITSAPSRRKGTRARG
jgi:ferritin-like metal-binding protein YciE